MSHVTTVAIILVIAGLALVIFNHLQKRHVKCTPDELKRAISSFYADDPGKTVPMKQFVKSMVRQFNCSRKEAFYLLGKAREQQIVRIGEEGVQLMP